MTMPTDTLQNSHVSEISSKRTCYIMFKDMCIGTLTDEFSEIANDHSWVIRPDWDNIAKVEESYGHRVSIPGIDMSKHKDEYVRGYLPYIITQRVQKLNSPVMQRKLKAIGMKHFDVFDFLCKTHGLAGDNPYYFSRDPSIVIDVEEQNPPYDLY